MRDQALGRPGRFGQQSKSGFFRSSVGFASVDIAVGDDTVFPRSGTTTRAGNDVVDVGFSQRELPTGVLAATTISLPKSPQSEAQPLPGNPVEVAQNDNGGNADSPTDHSDRAIAFADGKQAPLVPGDGSELFVAVNVEAFGLAIDHCSKDFRRGSRSDSLPISVQDENSGLVKMLSHGMSRVERPGKESNLRGRNQNPEH